MDLAILPNSATTHDRLYVNGRFLAQPFSGVQRFATEITAALMRKFPGRVVILAPPGAERKEPMVQVVGRRRGQSWEQLELPAHLPDGILLNLGNTAPLRLRSQIVVIHDAGVYSTPEAYSWKFRLWYKFAQQHLMQGGACVVTVSQFAREELVRRLGAAPDQIEVISEGADHMHRITPDYGVLARLPEGRFVLAVGNLAAHKNLAALCLLAERLAARGINLVITGRLAWHGFRQVRPDTLPQPACYVGRVSDAELKALYERAVCLVFPSRYEGFGLPAVEAMACGCPLAAARIPPLQEICGSAALYFDPASPADIAERVCHLIDDDALRGQLRKAALTRVAAFTWDRAARQLGDIAQRLATPRACEEKKVVLF